jgi:hypothetical protein
METRRDSCGPILNFGVCSGVCNMVGLKFWLFVYGIFRVLGQPGLVLLTQALDHVDQIPILAIQLCNALLVTLEACDANFMTPGQLMLMFLKVFCNLFWVVLIEEADGADSRRARCGYRGSQRGRSIATYFGADRIGERRSF